MKAIILWTGRSSSTAEPKPGYESADHCKSRAFRDDGSNARSDSLRADPDTEFPNCRIRIGLRVFNRNASLQAEKVMVPGKAGDHDFFSSRRFPFRAGALAG